MAGTRALARVHQERRQAGRERRSDDPLFVPQYMRGTPEKRRAEARLQRKHRAVREDATDGERQHRERLSARDELREAEHTHDIKAPRRWLKGQSLFAEQLEGSGAELLPDTPFVSLHPVSGSLLRLPCRTNFLPTIEEPIMFEKLILGWSADRHLIFCDETKRNNTIFYLELLF